MINLSMNNCYRSNGLLRATVGRAQVDAAIFAAMMLYFVAGCGSSSNVDKPHSQSSKSPKVARTRVERGPISVEITVEPNPARLSDEPTMTLAIDYEKGVDVDKPPFGESIGDFVILDFREPLPESRGDREFVRQIYTLEPTRTGKLQISPIVIHFADNRENGDKKKHKVETEALDIEIASVLETEAPSLDDLADMTDPVELPVQPSSSIAKFVVTIVIVALGVFGLWLRRRRRRRVLEPPLSPQELAYLELDELIRENLSETNVKEFYVRMTGIVRRFIERTTEVQAPEQTTEEFLREISNSATFSRDEQNRLKSFLESADLVKFAAHHPTAADIETTFERAKIFIGLESRGVAA